MALLTWQEGLGYSRRVAAKFDLEPETNLAVCSMLWRDGNAADRDEALRRYKLLPTSTRTRMETIDYKARAWPPNAKAAALTFLDEARPTVPRAAAAPPAAATAPRTWARSPRRP